MKAIQVQDQSLVWAETDTPQPGEGDIVIAVAASAINRADLVQRSGGYPPPPGASPILGLECSGTVSAVGSGVTSFRVGDQVCALLAGGGYAEQVVVPAGQALPVPNGVPVADAAALPEVFATAYLNLFMEAALQRTEKVLLHAGASGVGTAAIQMCRVFGNPCFVTAGSEEKIARCVELGAAAGKNRHDGEFASAVQEWAGPDGVDVILDPVGAAYLDSNQQVLALDGRLVLIGLMGGIKAELNLALMMMKRQRVIGSTLRARSVAAKAAVMDALKRRVWPEIEAGRIAPIVDARFPMQEAEQAHALVASDETFGKVLLTLE